ncbi:hypothetical protein ACRALDRAFT_206920 [Sodiomyces alcalophilus JCM 7366]|uniref:uncharacterized protein n=1 Tax=Sodiomyces alcalophilus JCM 7366 TaxID=591952 RepID=UPI0039B41E1B
MSTACLLVANPSRNAVYTEKVVLICHTIDLSDVVHSCTAYFVTLLYLFQRPDCLAVSIRTTQTSAIVRLQKAGLRHILKSFPLPEWVCPMMMRTVWSYCCSADCDTVGGKKFLSSPFKARPVSRVLRRRCGGLYRCAAMYEVHYMILKVSCSACRLPIWMSLSAFEYNTQPRLLRPLAHSPATTLEHTQQDGYFNGSSLFDTISDGNRLDHAGCLPFHWVIHYSLMSQRANPDISPLNKFESLPAQIGLATGNTTSLDMSVHDRIHLVFGGDKAYQWRQHCPDLRKLDINFQATSMVCWEQVVASLFARASRPVPYELFNASPHSLRWTYHDASNTVDTSNTLASPFRSEVTTSTARLRRNIFFAQATLRPKKHCAESQRHSLHAEETVSTSCTAGPTVLTVTSLYLEPSNIPSLPGIFPMSKMGACCVHLCLKADEPQHCSPCNSFRRSFLCVTYEGPLSHQGLTRSGANLNPAHPPRPVPLAEGATRISLWDPSTIKRRAKGLTSAVSMQTIFIHVLSLRQHMTIAFGAHGDRFASGIAGKYGLKISREIIVYRPKDDVKFTEISISRTENMVSILPISSLDISHGSIIIA